MKQRLYKDNQDWEFVEEFDPDGRSFANRYYFRGNEAKRIVLSSTIARKVCGYALIEKDLRNIIQWFSLVRERIIAHCAENGIPQKPVKASGPEFNITKALLVAAITFYGKLFTKAEGRRVSLQESWITDPNLRTIHSDLMSIRHNFTAHSGKELDEKANLVVALVPVSEGTFATAIITELQQPVAPTLEQIDLYIKLAETLRTLVIAKNDELKTKVDINQEIQFDN